MEVVDRKMTPCQKNSEQPASEENGMTIEFMSSDSAILQHFPEFEHTWILHGDRAVKASKIITHHELFNERKLAPSSNDDN